MTVIVLVEHDDIWEGTGMEVDKETDEYYHGIISERGGSYNAKLLKKYCIEVPEGMGFMEKMVWFSDQKTLRRRELGINDILDE